MPLSARAEDGAAEERFPQRARCVSPRCLLIALGAAVGPGGRRRSDRSLAVSMGAGAAADDLRPSTPEPSAETEREKQERRERRRLRRAKKEAEEALNKSPRKESAPASPGPDTPERDLSRMLTRTTSVRVAPSKPLPPIPEG